MTDTATQSPVRGSYTFAQLAQLWTQAGGDPAKQYLAAAVAVAESGGRVHNPPRYNSDGTQDIGLWQINTSHGALATEDPLANAKAAVKLSSNGTSFRQWCTAWSDGACGTRKGSYSYPFAPGSPASAAWNKASGQADPGAVFSGSGPLGALTLGAAGPGATSAQPNCPPLWQVGPFKVLDRCQARAVGGTALIVAGGMVMLVGTIVVLFRFQGTRQAAELAAAVPIAGNVARVAAGRSRAPTAGSRPRRQQARAESSRRQERDEREAARPQQAYDTAKAREIGRQEGRRQYSTSDSQRARWESEGFEEPF